VNINAYGRLKIQAAPEASLSLGATTTDYKGRQLKIRPLDVLCERRLRRMFGAASATNSGYMFGFVYPAASVYEMDGVAITPPLTHREPDDVIQILGREGSTAIVLYLQSMGSKP
jgi:hypothetical protein